MPNVTIALGICASATFAHMEYDMRHPSKPDGDSQTGKDDIPSLDWARTKPTRRKESIPWEGHEVTFPIYEACEENDEVDINWDSVRKVEERKGCGSMPRATSVC